MRNTAFLFKMSTRARLSALARSEAAQKTLSQLKKRYLKKIRVHNHSSAFARVRPRSPAFAFKRLRPLLSALARAHPRMC